ncbi:MAG TPA: hypothetical protein VIF64_06340 [Pyrinomonadaceae bacterium]|jgi:hypothetical protein
MGEEALVESQISDSIALIKRLEDDGDKPSTAIWYYFADVDEWRLLLAGQTFDALLPQDERRAYQKIAEALSKAKLSSLNIGEVKLVRTDYPLLNVTRQLVKTSTDALIRAHFKDTSLNGTFIKEMLILRSS